MIVSWLKEKQCPLCGHFMLLVKLKKRQRFTCTCGHTELRETDWEIAIRIGQHDRKFGMLKHCAE